MESEPWRGGEFILYSKTQQSVGSMGNASVTGGEGSPSVIASRFSDAATLGRGMSFYRRILFFFGQRSPRLLSEAGDDVVGNPTRN